MTREVIRNKIEELLSKEYYCTPEELNGKEIIYSVNSHAEKPYIKIIAYRNCIVVCTSEELCQKVQVLLQNKNRDEIFELPLVYGQTIHYVPDDDYTEDMTTLPVYEYECLFGEEILSLKRLAGFHNSLAFDANGCTPTKAAYIARNNTRIIGAASAAESSVNGVWEVGVDVMEGFRNAKLGTCLVRRLTRELLARNIIPFYSASVTNISSQMVACRCGYIPIWVDTFGTILDGSSVHHDIMINVFPRI